MRFALRAILQAVSVWQSKRLSCGKIVYSIWRRNEILRFVRARVVVNATGIFADQIRRLDAGGSERLLRLSKGTHLVFTEEDVPLSVTIVFPSPLDGRSLFLAKHEGCFLYGTSDHWEEVSPDLPIPATPTRPLEPGRSPTARSNNRTKRQPLPDVRGHRVTGSGAVGMSGRTSA